MQIRRLDATPYLMQGEVVKFKAEAKKSKFNLIQTILCYALWLIALAGDSFLIGMANTLNESLTNVNAVYLPLVIALLVIHIVPFGFWLIYVLRSKQIDESKWYAITNKRVLVIAGVQPINVTFVNLDDIDSFKLNKSSVVISFGEERITLSGLANPQEVADILSQIFDNARLEKDSAGESLSGEAVADKALEEPVLGDEYENPLDEVDTVEFVDVIAEDDEEDEE